MADNNPTYDPNGQPIAPTPPGVPALPPGYQQQSAAYAATPPQQVVYQQVPVPVPVQTPQSARPLATGDAPQEMEIHHPQYVVVAHSNLFYWWPVWVVGFLMTIFTWSYGDTFAIGDASVRIHSSNNLGVLFFLTVFLVILITNIEIRGLASLVVILLLTLAAVLLAYFRVWDDVLGWVGGLTVYLNQGAYFWFSTLMLITWLLTVFVFDRMTYWVVKPGQITREYVWGAGSESYDTENLTLEKRRDDLFRHWLLGLGSGDLKIHTYGAQSREIHIPNVLFVGYRTHAIEHMIAQQPATTGHPVVASS
jgi:hypothetical protein